MAGKPLFEQYGVHVMVDGQYGSTGKGALGAWLAEQAFIQRVEFGAVVSNAGPNSGHTFYHNGEKHVLKMLPTFAVATYLMNGFGPIVMMSAGAIIDPAVLFREAEKYPGLTIFVDPNAAVILPEDVEAEHSGSIAAVAGTRTGTGAALARKVYRDERAVFGTFVQTTALPIPKNVFVGPHNGTGNIMWRKSRVFMEVSQGFSLGINSQFYPKVTSRECTVMQGIADARLPPQSVSRTYMVIRTFPIRVGNHEGFSSGDCYPDQREITWGELGVEPELTTVTQRVRRVFTFSEMQYMEALRANNPDFVFCNFLNYLPSTEHQERFLRDVHRSGVGLIAGRGPESKDITRVT